MSIKQVLLAVIQPNTVCKQALVFEFHLTPLLGLMYTLLQVNQQRTDLTKEPLQAFS